MKHNRMKTAAAMMTIAMLFSGCGASEKNVAEKQDTRKKQVITEADLKDVVTGIQDHYVLQDAKEIDYLYGVEYDKKVVKNITVDAADVKVSDKGTYDITYTVQVDAGKLEDSKTDSKEKSDVSDVEIKKEVTVVDEEEAKKLADKDEVVWTDKNGTVAKSDGTEVEEKKETSVAADDGKKENKSETKTEGKKENPKADTKKETAKAEPSKKETSKKNETADTPKKDTHTHNYSIPITKTVHHDEVGHNEPIYTTVTDYEDQPIYASRTVCTCGEDITEGVFDHYDYCNGSYGNIRKKVGTNRVAVGSHQEQTGTKWVVDRAAYDETVTTGYKCSCGATK